MHDADVVVVGAGPAGSVTALCLAQAGIAVTIVERTRFPRRKACGEYLNAGTVRLFDRVGVGGAVRAAAWPLAGIRILAPSLGPITLKFPELALALERATLDALLLEAARSAGAKLALARAEQLLFADDRTSGVVVRDEAGDVDEIRARFVVGADGSGSLVARRLRLVRPSHGARRFALGGHYRGLPSVGAFVEMYVGAGGYFAVNPLDAERANAMVVVREAFLRRSSADVDDALGTATAKLSRGQRSLAGAQRIGPRVCVGPLSFSVRRCIARGSMLVGDACGFLDPFTGQGVYLAVVGAAAAAGAINKALAHPSREDSIFAAYDRERRAELKARRGLSVVVNALTEIPLLGRRAAAKLGRAPHAADALLEALSGTIPLRGGLGSVGLARLVL